MSEWINVKICKPPEWHSVLLYVVIFHSEEFWDEEILVGYYDQEEKIFKIEFIDDEGNRDAFTFPELENIKIMAWTLLPRKPSWEKLKNGLE